MSTNKRPNLETMEQSESSESDSDSSHGDNPDVYTGNEQVEVDFEGRSPIDPDCHGISQLLSRLFLKAHVNCMQMADMIIAQNYIGSVISQCDDDGSDEDDMCEDGTIFGITTAINMTAKKDTPCIEQLRSYIIDRADKYAKDSVVTHLRDVLGNDARHVGFLINERFINIPAQISVPLLENLQKEIQAACQKSMKFDFVYFLMIIKFYRKEARKNKAAEDFFTNPEEEVFCAHSVNSFEYSVADECDTGLAGDWLEEDPALTPYRKVLLIDAKVLPEIITEINKLVNGTQ